MSDSKKNRHPPKDRKAGRTFLSKAIIKQIAKVYDGQTYTIDALVKRYGLERHQVSRAARRGGYKTKRQRKSWTEAENTYLRDHWGRTPAAEIATALGRTLVSVQLQKSVSASAHETSTTGRSVISKTASTASESITTYSTASSTAGGSGPGSSQDLAQYR